jgi:hypothetical protein
MRKAYGELGVEVGPGDLVIDDSLFEMRPPSKLTESERPRKAWAGCCSRVLLSRLEFEDLVIFQGEKASLDCVPLMATLTHPGEDGPSSQTETCSDHPSPSSVLQTKIIEDELDHDLYSK